MLFNIYQSLLVLHCSESAGMVLRYCSGTVLFEQVVFPGAVCRHSVTTALLRVNSGHRAASVLY